MFLSLFLLYPYYKGFFDFCQVLFYLTFCKDSFLSPYNYYYSHLRECVNTFRKIAGKIFVLTFARKNAMIIDYAKFRSLQAKRAATTGLKHAKRVALPATPAVPGFSRPGRRRCPCLPCSASQRRSDCPQSVPAASAVQYPSEIQ